MPSRAAAPPASSLIDLNSASRDDLMSLDGIGEVRADAIIRARPFKAKTELVERRLIPEALYDKIADKVMARPMPGATPTPATRPPAKRPNMKQRFRRGSRGLLCRNISSPSASLRSTPVEATMYSVHGRPTIYALATPTPSRAHPGAISVIRLSGPRAAEALIFLTEPRAFERGHSARDPALPEPRRMALRSVLDPKSGEAIDRGLVVWFEAPHTETGETMAELHLHGGRAVVGGALEAIRRLGFCRLAEPGEFTRRAFEHGKLDLTQAEAIADLVAAETDQQRKLALQQMDGALHRLYEDWRTLGLAHPGPSRGGDRFSRRGPAARHRRRGAHRHRATAGRDRGPSRRSPRRAPARGPVASPSSGRPTPANPRCSIFWRGARRPSCRRSPARRAT